MLAKEEGELVANSNAGTPLRLLPNLLNSQGG